ncbi:MAG: tetratricopeptide repeat protein [Actinomycetota bacterium]|nr:tetratricopeptide repeat protein [Actinomycetota bacterium]
MAAFAGLARRRKIASAGQLRRNGDAAGAAEELSTVLSEAPDDAAANVEMARALHLLGDLPGAEEHYRRALAAQLEFALVIELAGIVGQQERIEEAEELLTAAEQIAESDKKLDIGEVHFARAMLAAASGRTADALASLKLVPETSGPQLKRFAVRLQQSILAASTNEAAGEP